MKTQSHLSEYLDLVIGYLKNPNEKTRAAAFGTRGAEQAARAAVRRADRDNRISSVRKNTRGLPIGVGVHQVRAAKRIKNALSNDPDGVVIGESRLRAAETTLNTLKRNAHARAKNPRPSKLARRLTRSSRSCIASRSLNPARSI